MIILNPNPLYYVYLIPTSIFDLLEKWFLK